MLIKKLKYSAAEALKKHPYTWYLLWNALPRVPWLLPHDKSYYGFKHIAMEVDGLFLDVGANNGISAAGFRRINNDYRVLSIEANPHHEPSLRALKRHIKNFDYVIIGAGASESQATIFTPIYKTIPLHSHTSSDLAYLNASINRDFPKQIVAKITFDDRVIHIIPLDDLDLGAYSGPS